MMHSVLHITARAHAGGLDHAPILFAPGYALHMRPWAGRHWLELSDLQIYDLCRDATTHGTVTGRAQAQGENRSGNPFHPRFLGGVPCKLWADACARAEQQTPAVGTPTYRVLAHALTA
jgi:hypothetical protein